MQWQMDMINNLKISHMKWDNKAIMVAATDNMGIMVVAMDNTTGNTTVIMEMVMDSTVIMAAAMDIMAGAWAIIMDIMEAVWDTLTIQAEDMDTTCLITQATSLVLTDMVEVTDSLNKAGKDSSGAKANNGGHGPLDNLVMAEDLNPKTVIHIPTKNLKQTHRN